MRKAEYYKRAYPAGTRIRLIYMDDPYTPLSRGATGTVEYVDDIGTIHMKWDNGRSLGICPETDIFEIIGKEAK
ncbi:MAG: DUF4314 domain-containing protein [Oscillospiraceae bacterium]|nr:DUF4314 domain-containing protein [Oscillospiraceae bacterium]